MMKWFWCFKKTNTDINECCICYEKTSTINLMCKHTICLFCIVKMKKSQCPYCRKNIEKEIPKEINNIIKKNKTIIPLTNIENQWTNNSHGFTGYIYSNPLISNDQEEEIFPNETYIRPNEPY